MGTTDDQYYVIGQIFKTSSASKIASTLTALASRPIIFNDFVIIRLDKQSGELIDTKVVQTPSHKVSVFAQFGTWGIAKHLAEMGRSPFKGLEINVVDEPVVIYAAKEGRDSYLGSITLKSSGRHQVSQVPLDRQLVKDENSGVVLPWHDDQYYLEWTFDEKSEVFKAFRIARTF